MKKNRINLLVNRDDYQKYENFFERLKLVTAIFAVILTVIFTYFYISMKNKFNIYEKMNLEKKTYLELITDRIIGDKAKVNYIQKKYSALKTFLKDDAAPAPYYKLLFDAIKDSSESASLKSFEVDKDRITSFIVSFSTLDDLMNFLKFSESSTFLKNFENITLKNFVIFGDKERKENYELSFTGIFVPVNSSELNEENN